MSSSSRSPATGRGATSATGQTRLPGSRERRPALAALAVLLILLGAAGSALIALNSGERQDFVAVADKVLEPGHKIESRDLARGDLAGDTGGLVPWSEAEQYLGRYTTTRLFPGQFVTEQNFTAGKNPDVPSGGALVGVNLEAGRAPSDGLRAGDIVRVFRVPPSGSQGGSPETLVLAAQVTDSSGGVVDTRTSASSVLHATILVPIGQSPKVAAAAAAKSLVLVKLAAGTRTEVERSGDGGG